MCRGCLFVKVDVPSGGDIDGCLKQDVIDEFKGEIRKPNLLRSRFEGVSEAKAMLVLNHEETLLDEQHCNEVLKQPKPKNQEEFKQQSEKWFKAQDKAYVSYEQFLADKIEKAEKLPMLTLHRLYLVKDKPKCKWTQPTELNQFVGKR